MELTFHWWGIALAAILAVRFIPRPVSDDVWFGAINLAVVSLFFGWELGLAALSISLIFWLVFRWGGSRRRWALVSFFVLVAGSLFYHKVSLQSGEGRFFVFQGLAWSYAGLRVIDAAHAIGVYKKPLLNPLGIIGYLFPFHMILAGPIGAYGDHAKTWKSDLGDSDKGLAFLKNCNLLATGLFFKFVVADYLAAAWFGNSPIASESLADTAVLFVYVFFDFSGYSAIALSIGRFMGVPTPVNFARPFAASSVTEFFKRWHVSLGAFVERNIYAPIQFALTRRFGIGQAMWWGMVALLVSWIFIGLWHRTSLSFVIYGLIMAAIIWAERVVRGRFASRRDGWKGGLNTCWRFLGPVYVFAVITLALHLIMAEMF